MMHVREVNWLLAGPGLALVCVGTLMVLHGLFGRWRRTP